MNKRPKVGTGVFVIKDGKILIGERKGKLGERTWGLTGGHLEFGEGLEECAIRESYEEAGIIIHNVIQLGVSNDIFDNRHYVTIFMIADLKSGVPIITNFDEFYEWRWVLLKDIPKPMFFPLKNFINNNTDLIKERLG